jgi:hypothetical protein
MIKFLNLTILSIKFNIFYINHKFFLFTYSVWDLGKNNLNTLS